MNSNYCVATTLTYNDHVRMQKIEEAYFDEEMISSPEVTVNWYNQNPQTIVAIRDNNTGEICAHSSVIPVTDILARKIKKGDYIDADMSAENIHKYDSPGGYIFYLSTIAVDRKYRKDSAKLLYIFFKEYNLLLNKLNQKGIYISELISDTITPEGERLCRLIGLNFLRKSSHKSKIYCKKLSIEDNEKLF